MVSIDTDFQIYLHIILFDSDYSSRILIIQFNVESDNDHTEC